MLLEFKMESVNKLNCTELKDKAIFFKNSTLLTFTLCLAFLRSSTVTHTPVNTFSFKQISHSPKLNEGYQTRIQKKYFQRRHTHHILMIHHNKRFRLVDLENYFPTLL